MLQQELMIKPKAVVTKEQRDLQKVSAVFQAFRLIDQTMSMQLAYTFVIVAVHEGISVTEVADMAGFKLSTASRHLLDLGERNRKKEVGYGLVEATVDPNELRRKTFTLTPKGKQLLRAILTAISN